MKNKFKSYSFWIAVSGAVGIVIVNFGKIFGFSFNSDVLTEIVDSICGVLILFGIITISKDDKNKEQNITQNLDDENKISDGNKIDEENNFTQKD